MLEGLDPAPTRLPARLSLQVGATVHPAHHVALDGQEASVVVDHQARPRGGVRLLVDWHGGGRTELRARVRRLAADGRLAHLWVQGVSGDWEPFLAWLGGRASA
jgi:hypothetical protein